VPHLFTICFALNMSWPAFSYEEEMTPSGESFSSYGNAWQTLSLLNQADSSTRELPMTMIE